MLYIVATPIGNLEDMTPRALAALREAQAIACEDTRRTRALLSHFGIPCPPRLVSYREHAETGAGNRIVEWLEQGICVALCSDGGHPSISDPGYRLVSAAAERNLPMCVLPGASAVTVALILSGLSTASFTFKGFPPRRHGPLVRFFADEAALPHTLILFESPFRIAQTLRAAREALGDRRAAVCLELTKKFERVERGWLDELIARFEGRPVKGEVTLVIAGNHPKFTRTPDHVPLRLTPADTDPTEDDESSAATDTDAPPADEPAFEPPSPETV